MQISIVLITHSRANDIYELLENINNFENKELLSDVVILDNASNPAIAPRQLNGIKVKWIRSDKNLGAAGGRNYATTFATGDILVYFDDDVIVTDKLILSKIVKSYYSWNGLIAFNVLHTNMKRQLSAFPHKKYNKYKNLKEFFTYFYAGCGYAIKRDIWNKIGGYPENFSIYMEEYDVSYRLIEAGYSIKYDGDITIIHKKSPEIRRSSVEETKLNWINKGRVSFKYLPKKYFYSTVLLWSIEFLLKSKFDIKEWINAWKVIKTIPATEKRTPISQRSLQYLKDVEARLLY